MHWDQIIYKYQTAPVIPAPHAHFYTLTLTTEKNNKLLASLEMTYIDREELDESDILDEGFSGDDDINWNGELPAIWKTIISDSLKKLPGKFSRDNSDPETDDFQELIIQADGKERVVENAKDLKNWNYSAQEIIQAIFEAAGKEKPFEMEYTRNIDGLQHNIQFSASFLKREFSVKNHKTNQVKSLPWDSLHNFLGIIFGADFRPDLITDNNSKKPGHFINTGDDLWYELGISILDPNGGTKAIKKIEKLLEEYV
jgi:hypothetical protein